MIHEHSVKAFEACKQDGGYKTLVSRILAYYQKSPNTSYTDRQLKDDLNLDDMNQVRPKITGLIKNGHLEQSGKHICPVTGQMVRVVRVKQKERLLFEMP